MNGHSDTSAGFVQPRAIVKASTVEDGNPPGHRVVRGAGRHPLWVFVCLLPAIHRPRRVLPG